MPSRSPLEGNAGQPVLVGRERGERLARLEQRFLLPRARATTTAVEELPRYAAVCCDSSGARVDLHETAAAAAQQLAEGAASPLPATPLALYDLETGAALPLRLELTVSSPGARPPVSGSAQIRISSGA